MEKYPLLIDGTVVYRGINFNHQKDYETFIQNVKNRTYSFPDITSWTTDAKYAEKFALYPLKGTRNEQERINAINCMIDEKANLTGYRGIVIATQLTQNMVLCDISEEIIGNFKEKEVILLPGKHSIYIYSEIGKEIGSTNWQTA